MKPPSPAGNKLSRGFLSLFSLEPQRDKGSELSYTKLRTSIHGSMY
jgi:hypothetical protein